MGRSTAVVASSCLRRAPKTLDDAIATKYPVVAHAEQCPSVVQFFWSQDSMFQRLRIDRMLFDDFLCWCPVLILPITGKGRMPATLSADHVDVEELRHVHRTATEIAKQSICSSSKGVSEWLAEDVLRCFLNVGNLLGRGDLFGVGPPYGFLWLIETIVVPLWSFYVF